MPTFDGTKIPIQCTFPESPPSEFPEGESKIEETKNQVVYLFRKEYRADPYRERVVIRYWSEGNHPNFEGIAEERGGTSPLDTALDYYFRELVQKESNASKLNKIATSQGNIGPNRIYSSETQTFQFALEGLGSFTGQLVVFGVANSYVTMEFYAQSDRYQTYQQSIETMKSTIQLKSVQ